MESLDLAYDCFVATKLNFRPSAMGRDPLLTNVTH